jgi:hypothetical protein
MFLEHEEEELEIDLPRGFRTRVDWEQEFVYIGVLKWHQAIMKSTIPLCHLEAIISEGLDMEPFYIGLRNILCAQNDAVADSNFTMFKLKQVKDALKSRAYENSRLPYFYNNRYWPQNLSLIETAIVIHRHGLMSIKELKANLTAFNLIIRHNPTSHVYVDSEKALTGILDAMRFISKIISPKLIIDWVLKCYPHLQSTKKLLSKSVSRSLPTRRFVMQQARIEANEFLSLMCSSVDRQSLIEELHDPTLAPIKLKVGEKSAETDDMMRTHIYDLD